jgi:hypothetical protein
MVKCRSHECALGLRRGASALNVTTFSIITLSTKGLFETVSINDTQRNNTRLLSCVSFLVMLNVIKLSDMMLSGIMLSGIMLSGIMLNVVMLSVVVPLQLNTALKRG